MSFNPVKRFDLILPAAVFLLTAGVVFVQFRSIRGLERENRILQSRIHSALAHQEVNQESSAEINFSEAVEGSGKSKEERITAFEDLSNFNGSPEAREALELAMARALVEVDPRYVLDYFANRLPDLSGALAAELASALRRWAARDLAGATAWLDRQRAEGKLESRSLDGRSEIWLQFEGAIIGSLLSVDMQAAARRLDGMPPDYRREVLQQVSFESLQTNGQSAYVNLVRSLVPQAEREGAFAHLAAELVMSGGLSQVDEFLDRVEASQPERSAAVRDAANQHLRELARSSAVTAGDVDAMRQWLGHESPALTDRITGRALAEAAQSQGKLTVAEATALVLQYHQRSSSDEVLSAYLAGFAARSNSAAVRHLAGSIRDAGLRAQLEMALK